MKRLLDRRLILVTGKGGVGRTTLAISLAHAVASQGRRVGVVELSGLDQVARLHGFAQRSFAPRSLRANGATDPRGARVDTFSLTATDCLEDFGRRKLKLNALSRVVFQSRVVGSFVDAVPGLHDLLQLGKIENLLNEPRDDDPRYDCLIIDAPATGHGLTLLAAARAMREITRIGPFFELARIIEDQLANPEQTGIALVTLAEDLPVSETLELLDALGDERSLVAAVVVNQRRDAPVSPLDRWASARSALTERGERAPDLRALVAVTDAAMHRCAAQQRAVSTLQQGLAATIGADCPLVQVAWRAEEPLSPATHAAIGAELARQLAPEERR